MGEGRARHSPVVSCQSSLFFGCAESSLLLGLFSSCGEWGLLSGCGAGASLVVPRGTWASVVMVHGLQGMGSVAMAYRLSCPVACGIFPDQGSNPCPLHWPVDA